MSSVNYKNHDVYEQLMDRQRQGLSLAEENAIKNPYGNHSFGGLLISQVLTQAISGGIEKLGTGLNGTMPEEEGFDVNQYSSALKDFTKAKKRYDQAKAKGNTENQKKWADELTKIAKENPDNRTIEEAYEKIKSSLTIEKA